MLLAALGIVVLVLSTAAVAGDRSKGRSDHSPSGHGSPSAERIIRFEPGTPASEMAKAVEEAGGQIGEMMAEISAVSVRSDDETFITSISSNPKVKALFVDRYFASGPIDERVSAGGKKHHSSVPSLPSLSFPDPLHDATSANPEGIIQWDDNRMNVPAAWEKTKGDKSVVVAVLDSGVQGQTRELDSNYDSKNSENGLDCRTIERELGRGFLRDNGIRDECRDGDRDGHGTWVASRIGAAANGIGSNGVSPEVTIRSYKVVAGDFGGLTSWIVSGMVEACHDGADIVNMSIVGYDDPAVDTDAQDYLLWADAVEYCRSQGSLVVAAAGNDHVRVDRRNVTVGGRSFSGAGQVSSGNDGIGIVYPGETIERGFTDLRGMLLVPGGLPGVAVVSATANAVADAAEARADVRWPANRVGARDQLAYYSNYGSRVDIAAPGGARKYNISLFDGGLGDVLADGYGSLAAVDSNTAYCRDSVLSADYNSACFTIDNQAFAWSQGTSMAAPNLSGVAALVLARHSELRKNPSALLSRLQQTARRSVVNMTGPNDPDNYAPAMDGTGCSTGFCHLDFGQAIRFGDAYGAGIVDAGAAVS